MRILAIDTSHAAGSVAADDGARICVKPLGPAGEHASLLAERLTEVAGALGWCLAEAELVAVVRGPGSFTGLRVGLATAKAIAWAGGLKLVGVSGFEIVARQTAAACDLQEKVAIAFDAGRGDVYAALAIPDDTAATGWSVTAGELLPASRWLESIPAGRQVSGPALELHAAAAEARGLTLAAGSAWRPSAGEAAAVAMLRADAGEFADPHTLLPEYSRPSYAEEKNPAPPG